MYTRHLPSMYDIARLSIRVRQYPVTRSELVRIARQWNYSEDVIMFLRQYEPDELFMTRADLVTRCSVLAEKIRHNWEQPTKELHNKA